MADKTDFGPRIGADPEFFIIRLKNETNKKNTVIPAYGLFGGTKENPRKIEPTAVLGSLDYRFKHGFFGIQEDNVMLELNLPATGRIDYFIHFWNRFQQYLTTHELNPRGLMLAWHRRHTFKPVQLEHPQALQIGCSPDFHAYAPENERQRKPFEAHQLGNLRYAGGHIHLQYNHNNVPPDILAKFLDVIYLQFLSFDRQQERRQYYGMAGLYRPTGYGIEYRTPSNFWLHPNFHSHGYLEAYLDCLLSLAIRTLEEEGAEQMKEQYKAIPWDDVQTAINGEDARLAGEIIEHTRHSGFPTPLSDYSKKPHWNE